MANVPLGNRFTGPGSGRGMAAAMDVVERLVVSNIPGAGRQDFGPALMARMAVLREAGMAKLEVFDVSDNRFSGRIPLHRASVAGEGSRRSCAMKIFVTACAVLMVEFVQFLAIEQPPFTL